jgi:phosphodiesterase/alkaline phosphatase D-like protein
VVYGEKLSDQKAKVNLPELVTEHSVILDHLRPNKKYYYSIGDGKTMSLPSENRYLKTVPALGSKEQVRIWALGDFGSGSANQKAVLKSMVDFTSKKRPDAWIWLGDNAYSNGKEEEYQARVFDIYQNDFFQNTALYPAPGNHDYAGKHDPALPPYFKIFTMPFNGEVGGLPSGAPSYYSVNVGQVHLVSIDT